MKSVIVQGATIAKAIDEALAKAGMPVEFFIKVLEEAQPGFLGFGSKKAKIALFFKKEHGKRDSSLLSRGGYKDLFGNENLQAQSLEQEKQDRVVEKKETASAGNQQPRKAEVSSQRRTENLHHKPMQKTVKTEVQQQKKAEVSLSKAENKAVVQTEPQKAVAPKAPALQRPMHQRPLKFNDQKNQEPVAHAVSNDIEKQTLHKEPLIVDSLPKDDAQVGSQQKRRPRRRRHYGYRSKAPIQWGKNTDESEQSSDERHEPESK